MNQTALRVAIVLAAVSGGPGVAQAARDGKIAVLDIQTTGIDPQLAPMLTEVLTVEVDALGRFDQVVAGRDIQAMLGFEMQKQIMGCGEAACLAEIGGALGVDRIVVGHVGKLGQTFIVNIKLIDIRHARTERRVYETVAGEIDILVKTIKRSVGKLFDPAPDGASPAREPEVTASTSGTVLRPLPLVLWGVAAATAGGGIVFGIQTKEHAAKSRDKEVAGSQLAIERGERTRLFANVSYGMSLAALVAGTVVFFMGGEDKPALSIAPNGRGLSAVISY